MSTAVSLFIVVFTLANIFACLWLMWWTARARNSSGDNAQQNVTQVAKTGHVWDEDLEEYNNPMPRWWLGLFVLTIIFALAYLLLYPGLGSSAGKLRWSQVAEHQRDSDIARAALEARLAPLKSASIAELARNGDAMSIAANLFAANCSTCHGSDARGARGFPNLTDKDWLYSGSPETIYQTIAAGRHGVMPPLGAVLGEQGVNEVASYVLHLSHRQAPEDWVAAGKTRFAAICAACHGENGAGNQSLGAPNLTDNVWLHGGDFASITATVTKGRDNQMPAHLSMLGETKVRLLAAYIVSLSQSQTSNNAAANANP